MNKNQYYTICKDTLDIAKPYAQFHLGIKWNVNAISGYENANGFIVQHVNIVAPLFLNGYQINDYYEAWSVYNGEIVYDCKSDYMEDDYFQSPQYPDAQVSLSDSIGKKGKIIYHTSVYWIDKKDKLYKIVKLWPSDNYFCPWGNQLKGTTECPELDELQPLFKRSDFIHEFDFTDDGIIMKCFLEVGRNMYSSGRKTDRRNFEYLYIENFEKNDKRELFAQIVNALETEFEAL